MKKNNRFVLVQLAIIGSLLTLSIFTGCSQCSKLNRNASVKPKTGKGTAIILLHDLWSVDEQNKNGLEPLQKALEKSFKDATVIAPSRPNSGTATIQKQAKDMFKILKKEKLADKNLVLIGHSQGGLVAFSLYDQYKAQLNCTGLITINTPWEGAPILSTKESIIENMFTGVFDLLFYMPDRYLKLNLSDIIIPFQQKLNMFRGVDDLNPATSEWLKEIQQALTQAKIPILALGSHISSKNLDFIEGFATLINAALYFTFDNGNNFNSNNTDSMRMALENAANRNPYLFMKLKQAWQELVDNNTKKKDARHDILISLDSQLAANLSKNKKFETAIYGNYHHFDNLATIINNDQKFYKKIKDTIEKYIQ